jgi:hypothetical protein
MPEPAPPTQDRIAADLAEVVARCRDLPLLQLVDALRADQAQRWRAGQQLPAESYLKAFPLLSASTEDALVLIWGEALLRLELGQDPQPAEYLLRFPQHADALLTQFELQAQLDLTGDSSTFTAGDPSAPVATTGLAVPGYTILGELGRGGTAVVYRARHVQTNRLVALRMILAGASATDWQRFRTGAEAAAQLEHPHIVPIYEVGEQYSRPYVATKLVEGTNLGRHLFRLSQEPRVAAKLLATVARALHHAHQRGILHGGLKPAHILVDARMEPHLTGFGLAQRVDRGSSPTGTGVSVGTAAYMAPEQAEGKTPLRTAVDVYSLGAILFALLTGMPPYRAGTASATIKQVLDREPVPPRTLCPRVDGDLELICLKCMARRPDERYHSAEALAAELERWLTGEPLSVRPPPLLARLRCWLRQTFGVACRRAGGGSVN